MRLSIVLTPLLAASMMSACLSLDGVSIGGLESSPEDSKNFKRYQCDNGYKMAVNYKSSDAITLSFNNGKDTFFVRANRAPAASGAYYENEAKTVTWHVKNDTGILTYPDSQYRTTRKLWETTCGPR
ncbi:MAG: MliC family protein [Lautropia sp.]|nr:MliC family protein [Lautropia sp.]